MNDDRVEDLNGRTRPRVRKFFNNPSLTRQEFKDECDLAKVIARFGKTPEGRSALAQMQGAVGGSFEDCTVIPDFRSAKDTMLRGEQAFYRLPLQFRARFDHDVAACLDFLADPANVDELRSLGLAKPKPVELPVDKPA